MREERRDVEEDGVEEGVGGFLGPGVVRKDSPQPCLDKMSSRSVQRHG